MSDHPSGSSGSSDEPDWFEPWVDEEPVEGLPTDDHPTDDHPTDDHPTDDHPPEERGPGSADAAEAGADAASSSRTGDAAGREAPGGRAGRRREISGIQEDPATGELHAEQDDLSTAEEEDLSTGAPSRAAQKAPARILVVEDDPQAQLLAERAAGGAFREVHLAGSAEEARRDLQSVDFDVVLLDLILPDGDGRQLLAEIRERPRSAQIQVVVLSGKTGRYVKLECFRLGADEFFEKPVDPEVLEAAVDRQVDRARARAAASQVDPLTGLSNRAGLIERFSELRAVSDRSQSPLAVALVEMIDLDRMGRRWGRKGVDRVQVGAAEIFAELFQEPDVVGRWEDGLFVALLPGTEPADAVKPLRQALDRVRFHVAPGREDEERAPKHPGNRKRNDASAEAATGNADAEAESESESEQPELLGGVVSGRRFEDLREAVLEAEQTLTGIGQEEGESVIVHPTDVEEPEEEGFRILMVEDDEVIAELVQHRMRRSGMEVVHLSSGSDAQDLIETSSPGEFDLALLDVKLPGADGFELLQLLRGSAGWKELPVVMVTSIGRESDVVRAFDLGADDYVLKPLSPRELLARVQRLLRRR